MFIGPGAFLNPSRTGGVIFARGPQLTISNFKFGMKVAPNKGSKKTMLKNQWLP